jgi:hypothetical protein
VSIVLLNLMPSIPDRPRGMLDPMEPRIVVARVVLRALRQLASPEGVQAAVDRILPKLARLSAQAELVQLVGHQEGVGRRLVSEEAAKGYEQALAHAVEKAPVEGLAAREGLLRLLLAVERMTGRSPLRPERVTPELTVAVLMSAAGKRKASSWATGLSNGAHGWRGTYSRRCIAVRTSCGGPSIGLVLFPPFRRVTPTFCR